MGAIGCRALLRNATGSHKLVGKGERLVTLLRSHSDPSLEKDESGMALLRTTPDLFHKLVGKGVLKQASLRSTVDPPLTGGSVLGVAFLMHRLYGSHKLIEEGVHRMAPLRRICDPPLTDGSGPGKALLRLSVGSHD